MFGHSAVRATGLEQSSVVRKRHAIVQRVEICWQCVEITNEEDAQQPRWRCLGCGEFKSGGATKISNHLLGEGGSKKCSQSLADDAFKALLVKVKAVAAEKAVSKRTKGDVKLVNAAAAGQEPSAAGAMVARAARAPGQQGLTFDTNHAEACDAAIAELFYACNISAAIVDHPKFKHMVKVLKSAPANYKSPNRKKLHGPLLDSTVASLQFRLGPLVETTLRDCATMLSDGWDTVQHDHLINFLYGNASCVFFDGTVELNSDDSESSQFVAELFRQRMCKIGPLAFIQVCTDTCSVMQAAWALLKKAFPWLTATGCGTHVLSLELKDMAKLPQVAAIISKMGIVLSLFWGRKRWPRRKLREVILANHGREFGLYRAKVTRFAGKFREMGRGLRVKADLQQVVVSSEYGAQKFSTRGRKEEELEDGEQLDANIGATVKSIVLDDTGFWNPMTSILYVALPLIKLLRAMDGNKPMIGKVYDRMFTIGERIKELESKGISWAGTMAEKHAVRWEYLHSPFHAAAYALDPEYMETVGELDGATQEGLLTVLERMALRDAIMAAADPVAAISTINASSPEVISRVAQAEREFAIYQRREGVFSRASVLANAKTMEPAAWWSMYGRHLPLLSAYAPRILAQPCAASPAERNWSVYGQIRSEHKARMKHGTADKLVYTHEALHLEAKMQDAGWAPDIERWESDTDSEGSEDEADFTEGKSLSMSQVLALCM